MSASRQVIALGGEQRLVVASAESMVELKEGTVDVAVTSPPYNVGKSYGAPGFGRHDDRLPAADYLDLLERIFREVHRVLRPDGLFFLNFGETVRNHGLAARLLERAELAGFLRVQDVIWVKSLFGRGHYSPSGGRRRLNHLWEYLFVLAKTGSYRFDPLAIGVPYADKSNVGRYGEQDLRDPGDVWFVPYAETTGNTRKKGHAAVFPPELPWRCLRLVPGARLVLDPCAGTCSTLAAAKALGLRGIGYEPYPPLAAIRARLAAPFAPTPPVVLPDLEKSLDGLLRLLGRLQGRGLQAEVAAALDRLPKASREAVERVAAERGLRLRLEG